MTTYLVFIRSNASAFHKLLSIYVFRYFLFGFEGRMRDLIVSVPDHCLSFYYGHHYYQCSNSIFNIKKRQVLKILFLLLLLLSSLVTLLLLL